jgi:non-ribosomal peptide synthetase component F
MLNDTPVYAAAIVLHPGQGWRYLELKWTTQKQRAWLQGTREAMQLLWENDYKFTDSDLNQAPAYHSSSSFSEIDDLTTFMNPTNFYNTITTRDEYAEYCRLDPTLYKRPLE